MRGFLNELARTGGRIAKEHFRSHRVTMTVKGRSDYVSHVDKMVEDAIITRIRGNYPDHRIVGEEGGDSGGEAGGPCWIIDPIDGTTNFIRGIAAFSISIAFCDENDNPRYGVVYDPIADELFSAERDSGSWLGSERIYVSPCESLDEALLSTSLPFRDLTDIAVAAQVMEKVQRRCDDVRRIGSAALDLAYVACGRLDAYYEMNIRPWDTAAGELLVRCAGGAAGDFSGSPGGLLGRRQVLAASSEKLQKDLLDMIQVLKRPLGS